MPDDALPIPLEIPWRLAASTQTLREGFPTDTTIALFAYEPQSPTLAADYPGERLIYLKLTVTVSPCQVDSSALPEWARSLLAGGQPVLHLVLDVGVTPVPFATGGIRPYFHAAAPLRRSMIETGIVGHEIFEGEADALSVGKSASQVYETVGSKVTTNKKGSSGGLPGIFDVDKSRVETTVDSTRSVEQFQETVNRDASVERKELLSHTTAVENVITLLNAKHVGSPFLRFALSPRPLTQLFVDPSDPNLWYKQLLQRRSGGIEGIQEFFAVVAVPRNRDFCIQALLRRICVLDDPPVPPEFPRSYNPTESEAATLVDYLYRKYPVGTPLDMLDVDVLAQIPDIDMIPAVTFWSIPSRKIAYVGGGYPDPKQPPASGFRQDGFAYKLSAEVRRDMLIDTYLEDLARSPLERGSVIMLSTHLRTCFHVADNGPQATGSESATPPPTEVPFAPELDYRRPREPHDSTAPIDSIAAVTRWNALERQLIEHVGRLDRDGGQPLSFRTPRMVQMWLRRLSALKSDDPRNLTLSRAAVLLRLPALQVAALEAAHVRDIKGLAHVILAARSVERLNTEVDGILADLDERERCKLDLKPLAFALSVRDAALIVEHIAAALESTKPDHKTPERKIPGATRRGRPRGKAR
jgi:hypothetical protein